VLWILCQYAQAQSYADIIKQKLTEAEDYLTVNPAQTLTLLDAIGPVKQPVDAALTWHLLAMRAAVPTGQLDRIPPSLDAIFSHQQHPLFLQQLTTIHSAAGIWFRRNLYLQEAKASLQCAEKHAGNNKQRMTLLNSMGLLNRELGDNDSAKALFTRALMLAGEINHTRVIAMVENNLGLLALDNSDYSAAEPHFRASLMHYQAVSQRSGQISAGLNLMLIFLLQNDLEQYQRLSTPTTTLTTSFPNQAKQALLLWLQARFQQLLGTQPTDSDKALLHEAFSRLEDIKTKQLIKRQLAPALQINVTIAVATEQESFSSPWVNQVKRCNWPVNTPGAAN